MEILRDPMLGDLIALDPSERSAGIAHFRGGALLAVGRIRCVAEIGETHVSRCMRISQKCLTWIISRDIAPRMLVTEFPQIYGIQASRADPNDLTPMAAMLGFVGGMLFSVATAHNIGFSCISYLPREWKQGTRNKEEIRADITTRLSVDEREIMPTTTTDEWDAVGIGLYALGRFKPMRAFAGAV